MAVARRIGVAPPLLLLAFVLPAPQGASIAGIPPLCPFHNLTGLPCPGCGITRAIVCCAHGLWAEAVRYHPLGPLVFAALVVLTVLRLFTIRLIVPPRLASGASWLCLILLLAIWGARLTGALPSPP